MQNKTFAIIKPDAVENKYLGKITEMIIQNEFDILNVNSSDRSKLCKILFLAPKKTPL